jgi:hypothetical protein
MKMSKITAIVVALLVLVSNAGVAMTVHYCGGKIASVSSGFSDKETCAEPKAVAEKGCCAKETSHKKCCSDKKLNLKGKALDVVVKASENGFTPFVLPVFEPVDFTYVAAVKTQQLPSYYCDANAPPLFKLYHQYIFYA